MYRYWSIAISCNVSIFSGISTCHPGQGRFFAMSGRKAALERLRAARGMLSDFKRIISWGSQWIYQLTRWNHGRQTVVLWKNMALCVSKFSGVTLKVRGMSPVQSNMWFRTVLALDLESLFGCVWTWDPKRAQPLKDINGDDDDPLDFCGVWCYFCRALPKKCVFLDFNSVSAGGKKDYSTGKPGFQSGMASFWTKPFCHKLLEVSGSLGLVLFSGTMVWWDKICVIMCESWWEMLALDSFHFRRERCERLAQFHGAIPVTPTRDSYLSLLCFMSGWLLIVSAPTLIWAWFPMIPASILQLSADIGLCIWIEVLRHMEVSKNGDTVPPNHHFYRIVHSKPSSFGGTPQVSDEEFRSIVAERRSDWARTPGPPAETTWATWAVENVFSKRHQVVGKDSGYSDGSLAWKSWE